MVIPESESANQNSSSTKTLPSPPWKTENASNFPKYSPAFKRKPFSVYETVNNNGSDKHNKNQVVKSDDSDNDSAVSSGRSSLSHSSVSPPNSPKNNGKTRQNNEPINENSEDNNNPRVLKKDSIEAINR